MRHLTHTLANKNRRNNGSGKKMSGIEKIATKTVAAAATITTATTTTAA